MATEWPETELKDTSKLTKFAFSKTADTYHCTTCGTLMFWGRNSEPKSLEVSTGILENAEKLITFDGHCYVGDTKDSGFSDWVTDIGGKSIQRTHADHDSKVLPRWWKDTETQQGQRDVVRLPFHCLCKGVNMYITRPTQESMHADPQQGKEKEPWYIGKRDRYAARTCACNSCRMAAGVDIVEWAFVPKINIKLANGEDYRTDTGTLQAYESSKDNTRYFCGRCGANIFWVGSERPELIDVAVGLIDAPSGAKAMDWLEWDTEQLSFEDDGPNRGLVAALKKGLKEFKDHYGDEL